MTFTDQYRLFLSVFLIVLNDQMHQLINISPKGYRYTYFYYCLGRKFAFASFGITPRSQCASKHLPET